MNTERFERLVAEAMDGLPEEFAGQLDNVDVVVADRPTRQQLAQSGLGAGYSLLGLYEGVPRTERGSHYGMTLPDKITLFQQPIEAKCRSAAEIREEIRQVVLHEIAHHFGIGDGRLSQLEGDQG